MKTTGAGLPAPKDKAMNDVKYKDMSNEDKIAAIMDWNCWHGEGQVVEQYLEALRTNNRPLIAELESFGASPRHIAMNRVHYDRAVFAFGFTGKVFNEHGWLKRETFAECETLHFCPQAKIRWLGQNYIEIGRGPNGKYAYALNLAAMNTGCCSPLSVFCKPYASRHLCLSAALEEMIGWHSAGAEEKKTAPVLTEIKDMLDILTGRKSVQMSLF
jgi:hypothetical protein